MDAAAFVGEVVLLAVPPRSPAALVPADGQAEPARSWPV